MSDALKALRLRFVAARDRADILYNEVRDLENQIVMETLPETFECDEDIEIGGECSESPIDKCAYNEADDPSCDCCVFCGEPWERK